MSTSSSQTDLTPADICNQDRMFLYVWSEKDKPDECKFGERWVKAHISAQKSVLTRVKQSLGVRKDLLRTGVVSIDHVWDVSDWARKVGRFYPQARMDDHVRPFVGHRKFSTGEIHEINSTDLMIKVNHLITKHDQQLPKVSLSTLQTRMVSQVCDAFHAGSQIILAELCARFGKTIWSGAVAREMNSQLIVVTSYVKTVFASFAKDLTSFQQWQAHTHVDTQQPDWQQTVKLALTHGHPVVAYVSMAPGSQRDARIHWLMNRPESTLLVLDEADFGSHTPKQAEALKSCVRSDHKVLIMTGTNSDRAVKLWNVDHMVSVTYPELLVQKHVSQKQLNQPSLLVQPATTLKHFQTDITRDVLMPQISLYQLDLSEPVARSLSLGEWQDAEDLLPSWSKFAAHPVKSKGFFVRILETVFLGKHQVESANVDLQTLNWFGRNSHKVAMMFMPHQTGIHSGALRAVGEIAAQALPAWRVITLGGGDIRVGNKRVKNHNAEAMVRDKIEQARKLNQSVLIISSQMAQRSFSIPEITELYLAYDGGQSGATIQKMSRVLTPSTDPTKVGKIISLSFDPNRDDKFDALVLEAANNIKKHSPKRNIMEIMEEILSTMDIWKGGAHSGVRVNKDEFLNQALARKNVGRVIGAVADISKISKSIMQDMVQGGVGASRVTPVAHVPKGKTKQGKKAPVSVKHNNPDAKLVQMARERIVGVAENSEILLVVSGACDIWESIDVIDAHDHMQAEVEAELNMSWRIIRMLYVDHVITPIMLEIMMHTNQGV
jgi:hypothetical protein